MKMNRKTPTNTNKNERYKYAIIFLVFNGGCWLALDGSSLFLYALILSIYSRMMKYEREILGAGKITFKSKYGKEK